MLPNHRPILSSPSPRRFLAMLALAIGCSLALAAGPARADDHGHGDHGDHGRGHWDHGHHGGERHWDHGRWVYGPSYGVVVAPPPPVYVAPAPVYAPPPVYYPPSVSLGVTIR